jgi:hypothetical protein
MKNQSKIKLTNQDKARNIVVPVDLKNKKKHS